MLRFGTHVDAGILKAHVPDDLGRTDAVGAVTIGGVRTIALPWRWDLAVGADVTFQVVPEILKPTHGNKPKSAHVFLRLRPPAAMGRMVDMVMTRGMH